MPCLCTKCHKPCGCDEILCTRCLLETIDKEDQDNGNINDTQKVQKG
jgi:hypothetical protein